MFIYKYSCFSFCLLYGGRINGSKLIIEGSAFINGNASNNLVLNFSSSTGENGIVVNESGAYTIKYCNINNAETGINSLSSGTQIIQNTKFYNCSESAINIIGQTSDGQSTPPSPVIKDCYIIANQIGLQPGYGISVSNINEIEISNNYISNTKTGIFLSQVPQVYIINNTINGNTPVGPGIFMESSNGDIRGNTITNHLEGIHLGNSSPNIGTNTIYNNRKYGIYAGSGSIPNMVQQYAGNPPVFYNISGFNKIYNNGGYYELYGSDGSEIYLQNSNVLLNNGCNEIFDNRIPDEPPYQTGDLVNTQILINGSLPSGSRELKAENNFWDEHPIYPLSTRFGSLTVDYTPYSTTPCPPLQDEQFKLVMNSQGDIVDTVFSSGEINQDPTSLEVLYSEAEEKFLEGNYSEALTKYESVISLADSIFDKLKAYNRLYTIGRLTQKDEQYFSNLETIYNNAISQENDSLTNKILHQNSLLSKVSKGEYISAITGFDNIIQQNPNSEEAFYAEIDILTTSLLADTGNTQLGKIGNGKYLVKGSSDYMNKLNTLMKNHFGVEDKGKKEKIIPTEYTLFQNYPNPFNPVTIIRYDIPKAGNVELKVYDILGREVKVLVNEIKSAGRYEVEFNASDLASGIYIYRIQTPDFTKSQKMILVR
ncbi:MAG TPA: right-handed parallel beta-helix repeat-containing protein [Mariniphaga sp.]|nr:right-handed parallel beta-helix repeat-containing protein [Mariniphaga sp.]